MISLSADKRIYFVIINSILNLAEFIEAFNAL